MPKKLLFYLLIFPYCAFFFADEPENVSLNVNITTSNNKVCADVVVNFTCTAEAANPAPDNYTLKENGTLVVQNMASPGVWIRELKTAGEVTYRCEARNSLGYNRSSNTTFTVGGQLHDERFSDYFPNSSLYLLHGIWCLHVSGVSREGHSWPLKCLDPSIILIGRPKSIRRLPWNAFQLFSVSFFFSIVF